MEVNLASLTLERTLVFEILENWSQFCWSYLLRIRKLVNLDRNNWAKFSGNLVETIIILVFFSKRKSQKRVPSSFSDSFTCSITETLLIKTFVEVSLAPLTLRTRKNWAKFSGNLVENIIILVFFSKSNRKWPNLSETKGVQKNANRLLSETKV